MVNPFKALGDLLANVWKWATDAVPVVQRIFAVALPVVEEIIALVPTNADGSRELATVIAAFKKYGLPIEQWILALPPDGLGKALMDLATKIISKEFPAVVIPIIQAAIQLAVVEVNAKASA